MLSKYQMKFDQTEARDILLKTKCQPEVIKIVYRKFLLKFRLRLSPLPKQGVATLDIIDINISVDQSDTQIEFDSNHQVMRISQPF